MRSLKRKSKVPTKEQGENFQLLLSQCQEQLAEARRTWSALMLTQFPDHDLLQWECDEGLATLGSTVVMVNAIHDGRQVTVAVSPQGYGWTVPVEDSLCVLSVGLEQPLAIDDIEHDPITASHLAKSHIRSWASVPLVINGSHAGTVCTIERDFARHWSPEDYVVMQGMAGRVSQMVEDWIDTWHKSSA